MSVQRVISGGWPERNRRIALAIRTFAIAAVFTLIVVPMLPFQSLSEDAVLAAWEAGDLGNQIVYTMLGAVALLSVPVHRYRQLRSCITPLAVLMAAWLAISAVASQNPELSFRRLAFTLIVAVIAAAWLIVPLGFRHLVAVLAVLEASILLLCYAGVMFLPSFAVHQASDLLEPQLAGAWRGVFAHKNEAGAVMALFVFFGVFVTRFSNVIAGTLMVIGAAAFLVCTSAKTSLIILPLVFLISYFARRARRTRWLVCLCLGPLIAFNALVLLACYNADVDRMLSFALSDSSFTGRTDVWQFAIDNIVEKPMVGHGFMAFWRTEDVFDSPNEAEAGWANTASHSHNGYLDIALTTGLPGLVLAVAFVVVVPIINYQRSRTRFWRAGDWPTRAVSTLLLRIWLFGIYFNCFESALFDRGNRIWFLLLTAIFGLHYVSRFPVVDEHVKRDDAFLGPFGAS